MCTKWKPTVFMLAVCLTMCQKAPETPLGSDSTAPTTAAPTVMVPAATVTYVAINPDVYVPKDTINGWINATPINQAAIDAHRWSIWQGMTAPSGQTLNGTPLPVWETWYDTTTVYANGTLSTDATAHLKAARQNAPASSERRRFTRPVQLAAKGLKTTAGGSILSGGVLSFNRFTEEMRDHVWQNQYYDATTMNNLNASFSPKTPIAQRVIKSFPDRSIMMKPVFWIASGTTTTIMPYWNGTGSNATSNPTNPVPSTWKQCVMLDPTGSATNANPIQCNGNTIAGGQYKVVPINANPALSSLYAFKLTADEAKELSNFLGSDLGPTFGLSTLQAGDFAIFVGGHVSTREIDNWTWQTFWYSPNPSTVPAQPMGVQAAPSSITAPWNNYVSCTAYYMVTPPNDPNGAQYLCYNPYLETGLSGLLNPTQSSSDGVGVQTNCMACHRAAAYPNPNENYPIDFNLDPSNAKWFTGVTKTDFSWATVNNPHSAPYVPTPTPPPPTGSTATAAPSK